MIPEISKRPGGRVIFYYPPDPQRKNPARTIVYLTIRGAISWPVGKAPFYYCIFGMRYEPTLTEKRPLVLLAEGEEPQSMGRFFEKLTSHPIQPCCERLFADLREENEGYKRDLYRFVRDRNIEGIRLSDSSEFDNIEYGVRLIKQWRDDNALEIPEDTILRKQLKEMELDDLKDKVEERFYAVAALSRLLISFKGYAYRGSRRRRPHQISNWRDHMHPPDNGGFREVTVD